MKEALAWKIKVDDFFLEVSELLGTNDGAVTSRAYNAADALKMVSNLSFEQSDSFKQAVRSVEAGLYRAAFVLAWTALADIILILAVNEIDKVRLVRSKWKYTDKGSLSEEHGDFAIVEALKEAKVITKSDMKTLHGLLHRRNQCAHKSNVFPTANEALGYIDESVKSAKALIGLSRFE